MTNEEEKEYRARVALLFLEVAKGMARNIEEGAIGSAMIEWKFGAPEIKIGMDHIPKHPVEFVSLNFDLKENESWED